MPGTRLEGENAACSTSANTFSGFRLSSKYPTSINGKSPLGQTFVKSKGLKGKSFAWASVMTWMKSVQRGKLPASMLSKDRADGFRGPCPRGLRLQSQLGCGCLAGSGNGT